MESDSYFIRSLVFTYSVSHLIRLYFYWPQMRMLWRSESGAGIAVQTWAFWSFHSYLTVMYFGFVAIDLWMAFLFFLSGSCTTWIAMIAARKQKRFKATHRNLTVQDWESTRILELPQEK